MHFLHKKLQIFFFFFSERKNLVKKTCLVLIKVSLHYASQRRMTKIISRKYQFPILEQTFCKRDLRACIK